ncbi:MAG: F0F1 ATP synthase subunit A [Opitutae bacterium]|nr:F0F1 ATP synthase subunit A [Opitutae bacterium]
MPRFKTLALLLSTLAATSLPVMASSEAQSGVSPSAKAVFSLGPLPVTNSMITSWGVTLIVILLLRWLVGKPQIIPSRGQSVVEGLIEGLKEIFEPIVGRKAMPVAFPLLICFFVFILVHNWSGLFPFVGTVGWFQIDPATGHHVGFIPWIRPHTADLNGTIALALTSFVAWLILVLKYAGPRLLLHDLFGNKADKKELPGAMYWGLSLVFLVVGVIEVISILIRPVTLSVRLFGNVFGGENLLHNTSFIPVFYFLEILVGMVQAFVFTLLTSVYIGLICNHGDDHDHDEAGHGEHAPASAKEASH